MKAISVVIPTYQRRDSLRRALEALVRQTTPPEEYEVLVSIDGSSDGTREMLGDFASPYSLRALWQPNRGRAAACNAGIHKAEGELIALLDDDMEPSPTWLEAHRRLHAADMRLGVIGAAPIPVEPLSPPVMQYVAQKFNAHLERLAGPGYHLKLRDFYSGNFSIRREILCEIGGYDEAFRVYGNEDLELSLRLTRAGVRMAFSPEARAIQHYTKGFGAVARDHISKGQTSVLLAAKFPETLPELRLSTYDQPPRSWRLARALLLALTQVGWSTPGRVIRVTGWIERGRPGWLARYYPFVLDYFYWWGVRLAQREAVLAVPESGPALD